MRTQCRPSEELYDLEADPHELNNLAQYHPPSRAARIREVLLRMRLALQKWMAGQGDLDPMKQEMAIPLRPSAAEWKSKGCRETEPSEVCEYPNIISTMR